MSLETKSPYKVRMGFFCPVGDSIHIGGEVINLTEAQYNDRKHMLEEPAPAPAEVPAETAKKEVAAK
jgi:hypothetical protein